MHVFVMENSANLTCLDQAAGMCNMLLVLAFLLLNPGRYNHYLRVSSYRYCGMILFVFFSIITKTCLYNFDPLKPHFYIVKLGFTGVYIIFLFLLLNIDCGYSLEPPHRGGSNKYPQSMF